MSVPPASFLQAITTGGLLRATIGPGKIPCSLGFPRFVKPALRNPMDNAKDSYHCPSSPRPAAGGQRFPSSLACSDATYVCPFPCSGYTGTGIRTSGTRRIYSRAGGGSLALGRPLRLGDVLQKKRRGEKITMVTVSDLVRHVRAWWVTDFVV